MNATSLQSNPLQLDRDAAYLKLQLDAKTAAALPLKYAQEVLVLPHRRITAVPNMPASVIGLFNQRSRVFWAVDFAQMLGLPFITPDVQQYTIAIIRAEEVALGLVVREVKGVMRFTADSIQSPVGAVEPELVPYLRGCVYQQELVLVLDAEAIAKASVLRSNA